MPCGYNFRKSHQARMPQISSSSHTWQLGELGYEQFALVDAQIFSGIESVKGAPKGKLTHEPKQRQAFESSNTEKNEKELGKAASVYYLKHWIVALRSKV